jgi:hypothetical protein
MKNPWRCGVDLWRSVPSLVVVQPLPLLLGVLVVVAERWVKSMTRDIF